jgi:hypothetical protein
MPSPLEFFRRWPADRSSRGRPGQEFRPALERLEDRTVCTVTYHGGPVLAHVEAEILFLGSNWNSNPTLVAAQGQVVGFLQTITNSTFMDMLTRAGYGVGRGTVLDSFVDPTLLPGVVTDQQIQTDLAIDIAAGHLQPPDANRLYFVFVEPGVVVERADGSNSLSSFWAYHSDMLGPGGVPISYALLPYLDGSTGTLPHLSPFETVTKVTSHELAEAVTDPFGDNVGVAAWYDNTWRDPSTGQVGGEIADIADKVILDLDGYVVQGVANKHDQTLVPAGAGLDPRFFHQRHAHRGHGAARPHRPALDSFWQALAEPRANLGAAAPSRSNSPTDGNTEPVAFSAFDNSAA